MSVMVEKLSLDEFNKVAEAAHLTFFGEDRPKEFNRFDYALVCHTEEKGLITYSTILEHDAESAYMQHGGAFPNVINGPFTVRGYNKMVDFLKERYPVITTRIFNDNIPMIKLALSVGFKIHGVEYYVESPNFKGGILLCLSLENKEFKQ
jgi:RimJ/RimL family protein N-acetyltransferase